MKVHITFNSTGLAHLAPVFAELHGRFPTGWIRFSRGKQAGGVLDVQLYNITPEDRQFFDSLQTKHLLSSRVHDPFG